jgi:Nucleotidyltransferase domain
MQIQELSIDPNPHHHELNPTLWDNKHLRTEIRHQLLKIAKNFVEFLDEPNLKLKDVTLSGSSAGYNYSEYSDIDLHLVVNSEETFTPQKIQYNNTYDLKIKGIPVELYVQPVSQKHHSAGIYSVLDNKWITEPVHEEPTVDPKDIKSKARSYSGKINSAIRSQDLAQCKEAMEELKRLRKAGLEANGEQSVENLAFKLLRARGQIDKLRKYIDKLTSAELSLGEHNED